MSGRLCEGDPLWESSTFRKTALPNGGGDKVPPLQIEAIQKSFLPGSFAPENALCGTGSPLRSLVLG